MSNPASSADSADVQRSNQVAKAPPVWTVGLAGVALVLAAWAAYSSSFGGVFTFDDNASILKNATIQKGALNALNPPGGATSVSGRFIVNLSLALNYQLGGFNAWGYHAFNLIIQILAGLTLFGLVRRTLLRPVLRDRYGAAALPLAFVIALLWTVHPLQTESVTYIIQRAESMMGLFYLLTLYCFVRGVESPRAWVWYGLSAASCLLGMVTKETMATAPLMVWLYDRTFVAGTFAGARRQRWKVHAMLACSWVLMAWIVIKVSWPGNAGVPNPGLEGLSPVVKSFDYALKQCDAIVQYLLLTFWPHPLLLSHGKDVVASPWEVAPQIMILALLLGGTFYALWRWPALGFLSAWFFVILAPTSSVVPLNGQTMAEHHMYLSLAAVMTLLMLGFHTMLGRRAAVAGLALAAAFGGLTFERNLDYRSGVSIWTTNIASRPDDPITHYNVGLAFFDAGRLQDALPQYQTVLRLNPDDSQAENDLGADLNVLHRPAEALDHLLRSISLDSTSSEAYANLGMTYAILSEPEKARDACLTSLRINPDSAATHNSLGNIYMHGFDQLDQAIAEYQAALKIDPELASAESGLGDAYMRKNLPADAVPHYTAAGRLNPDFGDAHLGLGTALYLTGQISEAAPQFETAVRLMPGNAAAHGNYAAALLNLKQYSAAAREFEEALRLDPNFPDAGVNLEKARHLADQPSKLPP